LAIIGGRRSLASVSRPPWNHNIHYHRLVLATAPQPCRRALDVGCGQGLLAHELLGVADEVVGIDPDAESLAHARASYGAGPRLQLIQGDVMSWPFAPASFDLIASVAVLHHLPLVPALTHLRELLAPGGVLAVVGLARPSTAQELAMGVAAYPVNQALRRLKGEVPVGAPVKDPAETLPEIRAAARQALPGAKLRLLLLFRYSLIWRKPA
jgi:SAM-dependent methyltransferase